MMDHMSNLRHIQALICSMVLVWACGGEQDTGQPKVQTSLQCETGLEAPTWDGFAWGFFRTYCSACHAQAAPDRHGAPSSVVFDTERQASAQSAAIRRAVLELGTMPVGGGVDPEQLIMLERYLDCGILDH